MKLKLLLSLLVASLILSSCNKDEIDSLDKRLSKVEKRIGDDPITYKFSSTYTDGTPITKNGAFYFKSTGSSTHYMEDFGDGTYGVYIERFADVDWNEYAWLYFEYNPTTEEVLYSNAGIWFINSNFDYIYSYIYPNSYTENNIDLTVKSFDTETGKISVTARATTTNNSNNNSYYVTTKAQTLDLTFKGQLEIFIDSNNN